MNVNALRRELEGLGVAEFDYFESIGSTNDAAKAWLDAGGEGIYAALADEQTQGRGQSARSWQSPPGSAIALSLGFGEKEVDDAIAPLLAGAAGLAASRAMGELWGLDLELKWPNDLLIERQKVGGILIESAWQGEGGQQSVIGIGINVASSSVAERDTFRFPASHLEAFSVGPLSREALVRELVREMLAILRKSSAQEIVQGWNARLAFRGEQVRFVKTEGSRTSGQVCGVDLQGRLLLSEADGTEKAYSAGEIRWAAA